MISRFYPIGMPGCFGRRAAESRFSGYQKANWPLAIAALGLTSLSFSCAKPDAADSSAGAPPVSVVQPADKEPTPAKVSKQPENLYQQLKDEYGNFITGGPLAIQKPQPGVLAGAVSIIQEAYLNGEVPRGHKELIATTISDGNKCPFCRESHRMFLNLSGGYEVAKALETGNLSKLPPAEKQLYEWAKANRSPQSDRLKKPPFTAAQAPEILGTAFVFHYINRMVSVLLPEPAAMPVREIPPQMAQMMKQQMGGMFAPKPPGTSLKFLPQEASLPQEFAWAQSNPTIAKAFSGFSANIDEMGQAYLSPEVRKLVLEKLQAWQGEHVKLSFGKEVEEAVSSLNPKDQAAARLALYTAFAPYRVTPDLKEAFQAQYKGDSDQKALVGVLSWSSFQAARRVVSWLAPAPDSASN